MSRRAIVSVIVGVVSIGVGFAAWKFWPASSPPSESATGGADNDSPKSQTLRIVLPPGKITSANVQSELVSRHWLQQTRTVPGRIDYNGVRRVDLKVAVDAVVRQVLVKPGDPVEQGTRLASLDSTEIGLVRAEVERNQADLQIADQAVEFAEEVATNLDDLLKALRKNPRPLAIKEVFDGKLLGDHRQTILSSYSRYVLAHELWEDIQPLIEKGAVAMQVVKQRDTAQQVAHEDYLSVCEQSWFDAEQLRGRARSSRNYAQRLVDVSRQKLQSLLGAFSQLDADETERSDEGTELTRFYLIAPFGGSVEQRHVAVAQRLTAGAVAFVVANTESLWVTADIRERDWQVLSLREGDRLSIEVPALGGKEFEAQVDYVGREVERETRAVPLIALLDNTQRYFKPGMFAWVSLPAGSSAEALAVPPAAVQMHDGQQFVFVEDGPGSFHRVDVTVGARTPEWVAIDKGLDLDQRVVTQGAFLLKSELLLEKK
ncbi:MAG: efflux RND transporter periplasmic adaptor subunit [Planctomycetaceae bacterium]|nr:efflux RND transporter periplasmic adaptor subunit [Planctomycetaceae bacterium]